MNHLELLTFARGSALSWALMIFVAGVVLRLFEIFGLGRKADLARPRTITPGSGWRTMFTRSLPPEGMLKREPVTYIAGYVFHVGLFLALFFLAAHIELFRSLTGLHWPALPTPLVDAAVVAAIVALVVQLANQSPLYQREMNRVNEWNSLVNGRTTSRNSTEKMCSASISVYSTSRWW